MVMVLKFSIILVYIIVFLKVGMMWKRCRFAMAGNEIILLEFLVPAALLLPCGMEMLLMRVSLHVALFGLCLFWQILLPKGMRLIILSAFAFLAAFLVCELAASFVGIEKEYMKIIHILMMYALFAYMYITFLLRNWEDKYRKSIFSMERLCSAVLYGIMPVLAGIGIFCLAFGFAFDDKVAGGLVALLSVLPLPYMIRYKPSCATYSELAQVRKKAYLLGKTVRDGQLLEDDGGILNGSVVDDARILYRIMALFEEEKIYRNYDIKIADVARRIGTNKTYLSRALNTRVSKNFCQFVNHYRIREICLLYLEDPNREIRLLSEQCGFSSKSNFSIVFKYNTGYTPGDWCRMIKTKLENNEPVQVDDYML